MNFNFSTIFISKQSHEERLEAIKHGKRTYQKQFTKKGVEE